MDAGANNGVTQADISALTRYLNGQAIATAIRNQYQKAIFSRTWQAGITFWLREQDFAPFLAIHAQGFGLPCISGTGNNLVFKVILSY